MTVASLRLLLLLFSFCIGAEKNVWLKCMADDHGSLTSDEAMGLPSPMDSRNPSKIVMYREERSRTSHVRSYARQGSRSLRTSGSSHRCAHVTMRRRPFRVAITDFGAVGDGTTLSTHAFEMAMLFLRSYADDGGAELYIPAGRWLTGSIRLISHLTLFLESGAIILGSQDLKDYSIVPGLPSYGRGRELPGPRYSSLINGDGLEHVTITGNNGTIDGQGEVWWSAFRNKTLKYTRGHLVELIATRNILISNLTFQNSPFWTIHPVYCKHVVVKHMTILAPSSSPNTDGIDPDSSQHVCIEDCYISVGDDAISVKSGWDEYGIAFGMPSKHIQIRRIVADSTHGISFGSEMSGGISNVKVDDTVITGGRWGVRIKTSTGRGSYVKNISVSNVFMHSVKTAIAMVSNYGEHPDEGWNRTAFPVVENIRVKNVVGDNITQAGLLQGLPESPFRGIRLVNVVLHVPAAKNPPWNCSWVDGSYRSVFPLPCRELARED